MSRKKVYVVRYGEYSDQGISGVFSTKKAAQLYCNVHNKLDPYWGGFWVAEYILDEHKYSENTTVTKYYMVSINKTTGEFEVDIDDEYEEYMVGDKEVVVEELDDVFEVFSSKSFEHAKKIAIEKYQVYTQNKLERGQDE